MSNQGSKSNHGQVTVWQMTEDERLAYIEKHPIKPSPRQKRSQSIDKIDYKWRSKQAALGRWGDK